jgi:hypothetical protein
MATIKEVARPADFHGDRSLGIICNEPLTDLTRGREEATYKADFGSPCRKNPKPGNPVFSMSVNVVACNAIRRIKGWSLGVY